MSGHSKWATIKRQKGINDQERGRLFSKLARSIAIAARAGSDPESNFKLRLEIEKARRVNMPKENINRAIRRGSGEEAGEIWEEVTYEAFGPGGVGLIIEAISDNKNRTTAEIKNLLERSGGVLAAPGAVAFQFKRLGRLLVARGDNVEEQILQLIDLGAEEVTEREEKLVVLASPESLANFKDLALEIELVRQPIQEVFLPETDRIKQVVQLLANLEKQDDVQKVYTNLATGE
jgi:YebC/PmpR family DNA-binding regulatory protein